MNNTMKKMKLFITILSCWITFPLIVIWIWATHPGKCALIWKKELCGSWWDNHKNG